MNYLAQSDIWQTDKASGVNTLSEKKPVSRILAKFHQVFPFALFPDDLIVEELRIVWIRRSGPWMDEVISIMATDIACVDASAGPFFGHVHIKNLTGGPEIAVDDLFRGSVYKIRSLVEGIALSARAGLKVRSNDIEEEKDDLMNAGNVQV